VTEEQSGADGVSNNPAGRVLRFLRNYQLVMGRNFTRSVMWVVADALDEEEASARTQLLLAQVRRQAESVPALMEPFSPDVEFDGKDYSQIIEVTKRIQASPDETAYRVFDGVNEFGWRALESADHELKHDSVEMPITDELRRSYVDQLRALIDEIADDYTLSPNDRSRIVNLLRKVEQALLDIEINGVLPVQEAAAAAGAIVRLSLWERVKSRPWARDLAATLVAIFMTLEGAANVLAIEQYFSDEPQKVIVIGHEDQQKGHKQHHRQDQNDQQDEHKQHDRQDQNDQRSDHQTPRVVGSRSWSGRAADVDQGC
jgi:hypothetical protein